MMRATALATIAFMALSSCASVPSEQELQNADYGNPPGRDHQGRIRSAFESILLDPSSARFKYAAPEKGWGRGKQGFIYGWVVMTDVNSKNKFGAFTGWKTYKVLLREREVHSIYQPAGTDLFGSPEFKRLK